MATGIKFGALGENWLHLCVDMQRLFSSGAPWQVEWFEPALLAIIPFVEKCPERTVFTRFIPPLQADDAIGTWRRFYRSWPQITRDRLPAEFLELAPPFQRYVPPARVIDKPVYSPWTDGQLDRLLSGTGIDTLVITGGETDMCVLTTVLGAVDRGFRILIAKDGICSSKDQTHDAVMKLYEDRFAQQIEVADLEEIDAVR